MFHFISSQLLLYIAIALTLFVPGYFLLLAAGGKKYFSPLESFVLAFGFSITASDFLIILLGKSVGITRFSILGGIFLLSAICYAIHHYFQKKKQEAPKQDDFSKKSTLAIVLIIFLTIFIKTIYLQDTIFPSSTDLGHHMYWSKMISTSGNLPEYIKSEIGSDLALGQPQPIADFIIGEHLIFSAINLISGLDFISAFPELILLLANIMSVLAIFILARKIFENSKHRDAISISALLLIGPLYALASPQAKFASGGVIGNTLGNFFIPLAIYLFIRAFSEKKPALLAWAIFASLGLAYTHHLSTFIFLFAGIFTALAFFALNFKDLKTEATSWLKLFFSPAVIITLALGIIFVIYIYTPTYLNTKAVDTAMGATTKSTRAGLTLTELKNTAGEARAAFAFLGLVFLFFAQKIGKYERAFLVGWLAALIMMSLKPNWLLIDIPSNRVASYIVFPAAIAAAYMFVEIFTSIKNSENQRIFLRSGFAIAAFFLFTSFVATDGFFDNSRALNTGSSAGKAIQTYAASKYLAAHSSSDDMILKDHNYLSGDSWIKLFFMRGYNYPLSRGYFKRYEDEAKPREQCTNLMISLPNSDEAKQCFAGTKTNFIMVNPATDSAQFKRMKNFWQVYSSDQVDVFYKSS